MCNSSPTSISVDPRGGIAVPPRTIRLTSASRGRSRSLIVSPAAASPDFTFQTSDSLPSGRMIPVSISGAESAGSVEVTPSRRASGSNVAPWIRVEVTTTKKMTLKITAPSSTPAITGKVASQIGIAPRSPAQPSIRRSRMLNGASALAITAARGRATKISAAESSRPSAATSPRPLGKTSSPSSAKSEICDTHERPW
jgi:hypothetical protein